MLVGNSPLEYVFIRLAITGFRIVAPFSIAYALLALFSNATPDLHREFLTAGVPFALEIYLYAEVAFFLAVYLPLKVYLQREATHPKPPSKAERRVLWKKALDSVSDTERYLPGWFYGVQPGEIGREDIQEFVAWSLLSRHVEDLDTVEREEMDEYVDDLEQKLGHEFAVGRGRTKALRTTFDQVPMQHRPLVWYLIVCLIDIVTHLRFLASSFTFHRAALESTLLAFPPRPLAFFGRSSSPPAKLSYWYKEHKSKTKLPMVFIHGIGIGLYAYTDFILQLAAHQQNEDDIGVIAIEILPISSRICPPALTTEETKKDLRRILDLHGWADFVLLGHSYGTAIASTILRDQALSQRVKATVLMDPICFLLHLPDVAFNFTRREPRHANERMLHYFSSQDALISHTLARRFFWSEYIVWKDDLPEDVPLVVALSAKDLIVPTKEVWSYLTDSASTDGDASALKGVVEWKGRSREVLWFKDLDHAGMFSKKGVRRAVAGTARGLCNRNAVS